MKRTYSIAIQSKISELDKVVSLIEHFSNKNGLSSNTNFELNLIVEELISNTIRYGSIAENDGKCRIFLKLKMKKGLIIISVIDDGIEFNPISKKTDNTTYKKTIEEIPVGGIGLHLVSNYSSGITYKRKRNRNFVKVIKRV